MNADPARIDPVSGFLKIPFDGPTKAKITATNARLY